MKGSLQKKMIIPYQGNLPVIGEKVFMAEGSKIIGKVTIGDCSSVWFNCVLRGDIADIIIGKKSNIQDLSVVHVNPGLPTIIEDDVSVAHSCVIHSCRIGKGCLIGIGAIILNGTVIGENSMVAAGSLLPSNKIYPSNSLVLGSPAKVIRKLTEKEIQANLGTAEHYWQRTQEYLLLNELRNR